MPEAADRGRAGRAAALAVLHGLVGADRAEQHGRRDQGLIPGAERDHARSDARLVVAHTRVQSAARAAGCWSGSVRVCHSSSMRSWMVGFVFVAACQAADPSAAVVHQYAVNLDANYRDVITHLQGLQTAVDAFVA